MRQPKLQIHGGGIRTCAKIAVSGLGRLAVDNGHNVHVGVIYHGSSRCQPIHIQTDHKRSPLALWADKRTAAVLDIPLNDSDAVITRALQALTAIHTEGLGEAAAYSIWR
jgi:hypothetical protein